MNESPAHWEHGISLDAVVEVFGYKEKNSEDICLPQSANEKKKKNQDVCSIMMLLKERL